MDNSDNIYLIVGLGNPGSEYDQTRHNVGFMFMDYLNIKFGLGEFKLEKKFNAEVIIGNLENKKLILVKPQTFMNLSGESVSSIKNYYNIPLKNIFIAHDDLDIDFGVFKLQDLKGPRQHNGILSIEKSLGEIEFNKIRIGVENRGELRKFIAGKDYVLSGFKKEELSILTDEVFPNIYNLLNDRLVVNS